MIALHAIWFDASRHLWAEHDSARRETEMSSANTPAQPRSPQLGFALPHDELRRIVGDGWDVLLISGAVDSELALRLPLRDGQLLPSNHAEREPMQRTQRVEAGKRCSRRVGRMTMGTRSHCRRRMRAKAVWLCRRR